MQSKQWRAVGLVALVKTSFLQKVICRIDILSQQLKSHVSCFGLMDAKSSPKVVWPLLWLWDCKFVSVPKFMNWLSSYLFLWCFTQSRSLSDAKIFVSDLFLESGNSIPRSLPDDRLVWIWCSLSFLLPVTLKNVANSLSMFYRCLRFRL